MSRDPSEPMSLPAAGEIVSFDELYRREHRSLLRLAWTLTGRRDLGEELVQDTMLDVHRRWAVVGRYDAPGAYARRVLLNAATSTARRRRRERVALRAVVATALDRPEEPPPDEALWRSVRDLPARQAQAVALHYLEDRPVADIATVLGIAESTVRVHLHRGRLALARSLDDQKPKDGAR